MLASLPALANDGVDRHRGAVPTPLYLFPSPRGPEDGYRMLPADSEGGADGDDAFRWARDYAIAAVRVSIAEAVADLGLPTEPAAIFDLSAENGDTPIAWQEGKPPSGRHPGGSHDGGINLDIGYFLTSLKGERYTPDYAACTNHFEDKDGKRVDANRCIGSADRLDSRIQARFFVALFRLNRDLFGGDLLEEIGIDFLVRMEVMVHVGSWAAARQHAADPELVNDMERVFTSDEFDGWARFHHHHTHLRFRDISNSGRHGEAIETLLRRERDLDSRGGPLPCRLRARLASVSLERAVEVDLVPDHCPACDVQYRLDDGPWVAPARASGHRRAVIDLPAGFPDRSRPLTVEARLNGCGQHRDRFETLRTSLVAPRQDPRLSISLEPGRIEGVCRQEAGRWQLAVRFPEVARPLVTDVRFEVFRGESPPVVVPARETEGAFMDEPSLPPVRMVRAVVTLSGRKEVTVPLFVRGSGER